MILQNIHPFISEKAEIEVFSHPYKHFVIKNMFKDDIYENLKESFSTHIKKCKTPYGKVGDNNKFYDAFIYGMRIDDCTDGWDFFIKKQWQDFVSSVFNIQFNPYICFSLHYHSGSIDKPSKDGWPHKDLNICTMNGETSGNDNLKVIQDVDYADDTLALQPNFPKAVRSVAMLFYLNNPEGIGGGTGIYENYNSNSLIKTIEPINNSLFAFEIGPESYHGYIGANYNRSAMVSWFHSNPNYILSKNFPKFKKMWKEEGRLFEYWKNEDFWYPEVDPEYLEYFSSPIHELLE